VGNLIGSMYMYKVFLCSCLSSLIGAVGEFSCEPVSLSLSRVSRMFEGRAEREEGWRRGVGEGTIWGMIYGCGIS
jgi:hypothetical protein